MNSDYLYDHIESIALVTSKKQKKAMLIPELKQILKYTYDPFKMYGIRKFKYHGNKNGVPFSKGTFTLLDHLVNKSYSAAELKLQFNYHMALLSFKSNKLFRRIVTKDLRCGISVKSINEVFSGLIPEGITAQPLEYEPRLSTWPCYASYKLRGVRGYYSYKHNKLFSRRGKPFFGLEHLTSQLSMFQSDFDGELMVPNLPFEDGAGLIKNKKRTPKVCYCVFDAPKPQTIFADRNVWYQKLFHITKLDKIVPVWHTLIFGKDLMNYVQDAYEKKFEGVVLRDPAAFYKPGYSTSLLKIKEVADPVDVEVIDTYNGQGKYEGFMGGVVILFEGKEVRVGGGWSDQQRIYYGQHPEHIVGKTIEIKYQEKTKHGSLRNPNFLRIRDAK